MMPGFERGKAREATERLLIFEVAGAVYAFAIQDVLEVSEVEPIVGVPMLSNVIGGVMHHHGDALPVLRRSALFDLTGAEERAAQHVLVLLGHSEDASGVLGVPVDRVLGIVDSPVPIRRHGEFIAERFTLDNRLVHVLDTSCVLMRAQEIINQRLGAVESAYGGEA